MRATNVRVGWTALAAGLVLAACGGADQPGALGVEGAHEHGVARVNLAVDGLEAVVEFISPAMGIYGFEYEPTTDEDRRRQAEGLNTLRTRFAEMLRFDPALGCVVEPVRVGMDGHDHVHHEDEGYDHAHRHEEGYSHETHHGGGAAHGHDHGGGHAHGSESDPEGGAQGQGEGEEGHEGDAGHAHGDTAHGHDHDHAEVHAEFTIRCTAPLSGSRLSFAVGSVFPGIESLDVQVVGDRTFGGRYRATGVTIDL